MKNWFEYAGVGGLVLIGAVFVVLAVQQGWYLLSFGIPFLVAAVFVAVVLARDRKHCKEEEKSED
jgi:hypothetical protein